MNLGKYYAYKKDEVKYSNQLEECIVNTCQYCIDYTFGADEEKQNYPIMMLGKIQSGKTRAFTGLIALAFDNDFDMVFILTKNSKALVKQTESRMKKEFKPFIANYEIEVKNIIKMKYSLTGYQLEKKMIIIAKKEKNNLDKIINFIKDYSINKNKKCIIIDDEADTTGIGYGKNKRTEEFDLRTVASKVNDMRGSLDGCVFVQVTATPYALYLQPEFSEDEKPKPVKPHKTILVPSGEGYIGGEYYFINSKNDNHPSKFLFKPVDADEHDIISNQKRKGKKSKIADRRVFREEDILIREDKLPIFKLGIINFIVGAIVLRENQKIHYAYAIHTATQKDLHVRLKSVADCLLEQIRNRCNQTIPLIEKLLTNSYNDILQSVEAYGYTMPSYDLVRHKFYEAIDKEYYSVDVVNSDNDIDELLDEETGELNLRSPFSIFVGGQVLDRGVTISNMIGFYYGRNPVTMQQDTVLQHSRMFGYRKKDLLSVTRFYTTERIHDNMTKITEIDMELREDIQNGNLGNGVYFITSKKQDEKYGKSGKIVPCAPDKIKVSDVILLKPHKRLLPVGFVPINKAKSIEVDNKLNRKLSELVKKDRVFVGELSMLDAEEVIGLVYSAIEPDENSTRFVNEDEFLTTMRYMLGEKDKISVVVKKNKNTKKYRDSGRIEDAPETGDTESKVAKEIAIDEPVILLLQENGNDIGWKERPFWWPILVSPKNTPKILYASKIAAEKIKKKVNFDFNDKNVE